MTEFKHSKSLGQNFLQDKGIVNQIIDSADITKEDLVIEIGPGMGALTCELVERAGRVLAVEIDQKLIPILNERFSRYDNLTIINEDILKVNVREMAETELAKPNPTNGEALKKVKVIGNLPYYITTPIIMKILREAVPATSITVMMQKEVADRMRANPGNKVYGALSVAVQYYCEVHEVANAPKSAFYPMPKVDSKVLRLDMRAQRAATLVDEDLFFSCIRAGFSSRRKTLLNCMAGFHGMGKEQMKDFLESVDIDPARRAETLSIDEFAKMANQLATNK